MTFGLRGIAECSHLTYRRTQPPPLTIALQALSHLAELHAPPELLSYLSLRLVPCNLLLNSQYIEAQTTKLRKNC